jgi:hypothetical protein
MHGINAIPNTRILGCAGRQVNAGAGYAGRAG